MEPQCSSISKRVSFPASLKMKEIFKKSFLIRIHICVTFMHTKAGVADNFVNDIESIVSELMKTPEKPVEGKMALYGVAQAIPDRSIVGDFTKLFLDSLYFTPKKPKKLKKTENPKTEE